MAEPTPDSQAETLDVQLNEAFSRLEKKQMSNTDAETKESGDQQVTPNRGGFVGVLGVVLSLLAMGMASYAIYRTLMPGPPVLTEEALAQQVALLTERQARVVAGLNQKIDEQLASVGDADETATRLAIAGLREELLALVGTGSQDWLMAEVEYLLRLANQRVLMERDPQGAISLLQAADEIIRDAQGITAFNLREAIATDLRQLNTVANLDVDGIYLQLSALVHQVDDLRQAPLHFSPTATVIPEPVQAELTFLQRSQQVLGNAAERLSALVDFRRDGAVITPLLTPREEYYLRQNLVLQLQIARLALLRGDQAIYASALLDASRWVPLHFDPDSQTTRSFQAGIEELRSISINRSLPDISGSLKAVRQLLAGFEQKADRSPSSRTVDPGENQR